jgi:hypothetical protein
MQKRKIKSLTVRPCEHEFDVQLRVTYFKKVGEMAVIRSMDPMISKCTECGYIVDEMVGAGYVFLNRGEDDSEGTD